MYHKLRIYFPDEVIRFNAIVGAGYWDEIIKKIVPTIHEMIDINDMDLLKA